MVGKSVLKAVAWLFALALPFIIAPVSASAVSATDIETHINATYGLGTTYSPGLSATVSASEPNTVTVTGGLENMTTGLVIGAVDAGVTIVWEASLSGDVASDLLLIYGSSGASEMFLKIQGGAKIVNTASSGTAVYLSNPVALEVDGSETEISGHMGIQSTWDVTINDGKISNGVNGGTAVLSAGSVNVKGGAITASGTSALTILSFGDISVANATVTASGDNIYAISSSGDVTIDNATVTAESTVFCYAIAASNVTVTNQSTIKASSSGSGSGSVYNCRAIAASGDVALTNSTVTASGDDSIAIDAGGDVDLGDKAVIKSSGTDSYAISLQNNLAAKAINVTGEAAISGVIGDYLNAATITLNIKADGTLKVLADETLTFAAQSTINIEPAGTLRLEKVGILNIGTGSTINNDGIISNCGRIAAISPITLKNNGTILTLQEWVTGIELTGKLGNPPCVDSTTPPTTPAETTPPTAPPYTPPPHATTTPEPTKAKKKDNRPAPIVPILYDFEKNGDRFTFTVIAANAEGNLAGAVVTVMLNGTYSAKVTLDAQGVGRGTLQAPGFKGADAIFTAKIDGMGTSVAVPTRVYTNGRVVRR